MVNSKKMSSRHNRSVPGSTVDKNNHGVETAIPIQKANSARAKLPTDEFSRLELQRRAELLASRKIERKDLELQQFLRFRLGPCEWYGIPYQWLDELLLATGVAQVPGTPAFIHGVINYQSELLTVLDLKYFFHTRSQVADQDARIVLVKSQGLHLGLLVDEVAGNEWYSPADLALPLASADVVNSDYVKGIHHGNVTLLNLDELLRDPGLLINERD